MSRPSAEVIARSLVAAHYIQQDHFEVWLRARKGETMAAIHFDYPLTHGGQRRSGSTLYAWVHKVEQAIEDARGIDPPPPEEERNPFGISIAESHDVRLAADNTPKKAGAPAANQHPLVSNFPDAERLMMSGKRPRQ